MTNLNKNKFIRIVLAGIIFCAFGAVFMPFSTPILLAALFAFAFDPILSRYSQKRSTRKLPIALILVSMFLIILFPIGLVVYQLTSTAKSITQAGLSNTSILRSIEGFLAKLSQIANNMMEQMHIENSAIPDQGEFIAKIGSWFATFMANLAAQTPQMILDLFIFSASLYFFLSESKGIRTAMARFRIVSDSELNQIIQLIQKSSYITLVAHAIIGSIQAIIVATGAALFGYTEFLFIFVITFCSSLIPVVGAAPIAIILSLLSLAQGNISATIGLIVVGVIAGSVDNIIKPWIVSFSGDDELNPVIALVAIIGAVLVYGLPGLFLGPILTQLAFKIVPILFGEEEAG